MDLSGYILGESEGNIELGSAGDGHDVALALFEQARREVLIASYDLESAILDHEDVVDALSRLARGHRLSEVRILLQSPDRALRHGHRLVTLAQRLSSHIKIHRPGEEHKGLAEAFIVVDGIGYIKRQQADRFEGIASFKAPIEARDLRAAFNTMWERSEPEIQLRRMQL